MAIIQVKPNTLHQLRPAIQKPRAPKVKPRTIGEAYAKSTGFGRLPQNKAGQA